MPPDIIAALEADGVPPEDIATLVEIESKFDGMTAKLTDMKAKLHERTTRLVKASQRHSQKE